MDLKDYVKETTLAIFSGIQEANTELQKKYDLPDSKGVGAINPIFTELNETSRDRLTEILFDVATTVSNAQTGGAGGRIEVFGANIGADGSLEHSSQHISRVSFKLAVILPTRNIL